MLKRGLTYQEAMEYVGVKRRTFDEKWRPHLVGIPQGTAVIFDRADLDRLFDQFKAAASSQVAANDSTGTTDAAHNAPRNGRPIVEKGAKKWATKQAGYIPTRTGSGKSISGSSALDFASAVSSVMMKRSGG